jgi:thiamine-phosphate pyrophosphorylase
LNITLPNIYPITDTSLSGLSHIEQVRRMVSGGATFIQLRDKLTPAGEFYQSVVEVMSFARELNVKVIVNDRVDIALAAGADGVHLGQDDLPVAEARKILGPGAIIGVSTHSIDQVSEAVELPVDYIAIGPVFATRTKRDHEPLVGLSLVHEARLLAKTIPVVAIGGIDLSNAAAVLSAGANSVAVISDILSAPDEIEDRVRKFLQVDSNTANDVGNL